jgi:DNA repair photolyase
MQRGSKDHCDLSSLRVSQGCDPDAYGDNRAPDAHCDNADPEVNHAQQPTCFDLDADVLDQACYEPTPTDPEQIDESITSIESIAPPKTPSPKKLARGADWNPKNRFEKLEYTPLADGEFDEIDPADRPSVRTEFFTDDSQSILSRNRSPDIPFDVSVNPYRGCEHGCAYCYARPTHEFLGWSAGLDFESRILVKRNAPELLRAELLSKHWKPQLLVMSGVTDCYQPIERQLQITRGCLAVLAEFRNPVSIITKNHLVTRDIDHLAELARHQAVEVNLSVTTLDPKLVKILEPRASSPSRRLAAIRELTAAGIPVYVMVAPVIPGLNDHELPAIIEAVAEAGAHGAAYIPLRLPLTVAPIFERWLEQMLPGHKEKILERIRDLRGGKLNDARFGNRMRGEGVYADLMRTMFNTAMRKAGLRRDTPPLSTAAFRVISDQMTLF